MNHSEHNFDTVAATLRAAFNTPLPGLEACMEMAPQNPRHMHVEKARQNGCREGAVLILLYPYENDVYTLLTVRSSALRTHSGQISLPGGRIDAGETARDTALRETHEELGILPDTIEVIGGLTQVYIPPSNYCLSPMLGITPTRPVITPNPDEVAAVIELPARHLVDKANRVIEEWIIEGEPRKIPYFLFQEHKIWGATAIILSEFAVLWENVIGGERREQREQK
jgi:8-oxo-dGTP pyrophosphatase MutT (NUDIX family)